MKALFFGNKITRRRSKSYRNAAPFTAHSSQALRRPTRFPAMQAFRIATEITLPPMMILHNITLQKLPTTFCKQTSHAHLPLENHGTKKQQHTKPITKLESVI